MSLRILSGFYKGRKVPYPKKALFRPTQGILRESLFNILQPLVEGSIFLDLFAGSGVIGLEALSRGAKQVFFVEKEKPTWQSLKKIIQAWEIQDRCHLFLGDASLFLSRFASQQLLFDIIFLDPPYACSEEEKKQLLVASKQLLSASGSLFLEQPYHKKAQKISVEGLSFLWERKFGGSSLCLFKLCTT